LSAADTQIGINRTLRRGKERQPGILTRKNIPGGKEYITNLYTAVDFIGHAALLEDSNYDDSAEVLEEAEIVSIPEEDFLQAIFHDMNITTKFIKLISKEVKEKEERLLHLAYDSLRKRVAPPVHFFSNHANYRQFGLLPGPQVPPPAHQYIVSRRSVRYSILF